MGLVWEGTQRSVISHHKWRIDWTGSTLAIHTNPPLLFKIVNRPFQSQSGVGLGGSLLGSVGGLGPSECEVVGHPQGPSIKSGTTATLYRCVGWMTGSFTLTGVVEGMILAFTTHFESIWGLVAELLLLNCFFSTEIKFHLHG